MIRLDAIPITSLPQVSKADVPGSYVVRVNCVLHSGKLADYQELEVLLNGVPQTGVHEGDQIVFTWQFYQASDEIRVNLLSRGMRMRYWRGCWNERDAILHAGTLPVQVFFDGKPQPLLEAMMALASSAALANGSSPLTASVNGSRHTGTAVLEKEQEEQQGGEESELPGREQKIAVVQDLLIIAASGQTPDAQQEREMISEEDHEIEDEDESWEEEEGAIDSEEGEGANAAQWGEEGMVLDEKEEEEEDVYGENIDNEEVEHETWVEAETAGQEEVERNDEVQQVKDVEAGEAIVPNADIHDFIGGDEQECSARNSLEERRIAAFHASPLSLEKTLQSLENLMATMPPKTLIVDVRPKDRQKKKYQEQDSLSKHLLRSVFGAKYWDRGWAIQIVYQVIPPIERVGFSTWRYVVDKPESHPEGIPSLVKKLEEGYSIVIMDSIATYSESRRKAVIDELQMRYPALDIGPLG
jgi:hypothetical protein